MTRKNGGVVETCQQMEYVNMQEKKLVIDGEWFTLFVFEQEDGLRLELEHNIKGKRYKFYPDNILKLEGVKND